MAYLTAHLVLALRLEDFDGGVFAKLDYNLVVNRVDVDSSMPATQRFHMPDVAQLEYARIRAAEN